MVFSHVQTVCRKPCHVQHYGRIREHDVQQKQPDKKNACSVTPFTHLARCSPVLSCRVSFLQRTLLCQDGVFISLLVFLTEVAEELGRAAASSSVVPYLPRLPILPSKTRTLKKQAENKENIEGAQDATDNSASSSAPGMSPWAGRVRLLV